MRAAYADPPYLGLAKEFYGKLHPRAGDYDTIAAHAALITRLSAEYDTWALSLHAPALQQILPLCPSDVRVLAWVKPFSSYKPGPRLQYCWEPIILRGGGGSGPNRSNRCGIG